MKDPNPGIATLSNMAQLSAIRRVKASAILAAVLGSKSVRLATFDIKERLSMLVLPYFFGYGISWPVFYFYVYFADVFANYA